ncbi:hypothetical protein C8J57DRAFT_54852 [Mycena rebaudengoi]|nr:hypothetical protein C8J57DRAFT_54852 [Mycena rebaudengoi]
MFLIFGRTLPFCSPVIHPTALPMEEATSIFGWDLIPCSVNWLVWSVDDSFCAFGTSRIAQCVMTGVPGFSSRLNIKSTKRLSCFTISMYKTPLGQRTLERGTACLSCKKRKARCDGKRPACVRCTGLGRAEDCEYLDSRGQSETEKLEASIARLENRIRQLGGTLPTSPEVVYHEPHLEGQPLGSSFAFWNSRRRDRPQQSPQGQLPLPDNWWRTPVPPPQVGKVLINFFSRHASQFGFFLNGPRLMNSVFSSNPSRPPSSTLLNVMFLFGIRLSGSPALQTRESVFLGRTLESATPMQPHQILQNIQAEVLIAHYFLSQGRFLEAMHRINTAVSLSIGCGLHRLNGSNTSAYNLPSPRDSVEQGERVNAFWSILTVHKCWSIILQWPSSVSDILDEKIDLPWPLDMELYESGIIPINPHQIPTMKAFIENPMTANIEAASSCLAQVVKAATLFERASHMGGNQMNLADQEEYAQFLAFENGLDHFIRTLPSFQNVQGSIDVIRHRLVAFTLCQVAIIQLHSTYDNPTSIHKCLTAVRAVIAVNQTIPNMQAWDYVNPTMGVRCPLFLGT